MNSSLIEKGSCRIYLVLIKAKQDQLKSVKFLEPFQPLREAFYQIDSSAEKPTLHLNPKELIRRYQLEKSQLAFTFSLRSKDGNGFVDQWDTTVYSTVLTGMCTRSSIFARRSNRWFSFRNSGRNQSREESSVSKLFT